MSFVEIRHQRSAQRCLQTALGGPRAPHAYIFHGPEGVGKEMLARAFARVLMCGRPAKHAADSEEAEYHVPGDAIIDAWYPGEAGGTILGEPVYASLSDIPADISVDMVDIFRRSSAVPAVVDEALSNLPGVSVIWTQLGVRHDAAADKARARGVTVVQDRCPKIEFPRHL